ncbi:MAG: hypothetical protein JWQ25_3303, partial [Daejeonella sp.]|nr:hypothetical protein [Daejeonella sp.]
MLQSVHVQLFAYFIIVIAIVFSLNMVIQFLREKKLNNESIGVNYHLPDLLLLLSRIFYFSGWGFIISNTLALI